jgi:hypothetical protein
MVELMMSLIIMGLLVSLLGVAVGFAVNKAKEVRMTSEISNLDVAFQNYKNQFGGEYPPCMAVPILGGTQLTSPSRLDLFNRALRKRFARYTLDYLTLRSILANGAGASNLNPPPWTVSSISTGQHIALDLQTLDAAEALVFWLAGPPAPLNVASSTILYGFSANPTNPFQQAGSRLPSLFDFDETRLTDVDGDGWPEYTPAGTSNKSIGMAPFVYFEPASMTYINLQNNSQLIACYPPKVTAIPIGAPTYAPQGNPPQLPVQPGTYGNSGLGAEWGLAVPYPTSVNTSTTNYTFTFWNPKKFQIICAGADSDYGGSNYEPPPPESSGGGRANMPVLPQTAKQGATGFIGTPILLQGDLDNLTNFTTGKLEDFTPQ